MTPKYLYKFYPLYCDKKKESNQRISLLAKKSFWLNNQWLLNDPTEFIFYKKEYTTWESIVSLGRNFNLITSFSKQYRNLPMWAHYANNHHGFVVKFRVKNNQDVYLYPVIYVKHVQSFDELFRKDNEYWKTKQQFERIEKYIAERNINAAVQACTNAEFIRISANTYCKANIICRIKHYNWKYENEYRLIVPVDSPILHDDNLLSFENALMEPVHIYAGINCSEIHLNKLNKLSEKWGIEHVEHMNIEDFI